MRFTNVATLVDHVLDQVGQRIVLGVPLGLGKPNHIVNEIYRRAAADPSIELEILTALTLSRPTAAGELERRLLEPMARRIFGDYPELAYTEPRMRGQLPPNIRVVEFYLAPGELTDVAAAQRDYVSLNYTHAVRHLLEAGVNVVATLVGEADDVFSLGSNADLVPELLPQLAKRRRAGERVMVLAQVNRNMPMMVGDALLSPDAVDAVLEGPAATFELFGPPKRAVSAQDYLIGLHASALLRDGGTLQLGIGSLGDAITYALILRQHKNAVYRGLLAGTPAIGLIERIGGLGQFRRGLYGNTEMLVDGFLHLWEQGILIRRAYASLVVQELVDAGKLSEQVTSETLRVLRDEGVSSRELLIELGVLQASAPASLDDVRPEHLGERLRGVVCHAGFFIGPRSMYERLRTMSAADRAAFEMRRISYVNALYGEEELKRAQRRHARFLNTAMKITLDGAAASDALEDGRVVSGVGGQHDFVTMAHALEEGRSILMVRAVRGSGDQARSNIVWRYGTATIPRHLRDVVVSEYGIADLRGKTDREVAEALIAIADSRFQPQLVAAAKAADKLPRDWAVPDSQRHNLPARVAATLERVKEAGLFPAFPFGTDLTAEEVLLARVLPRLRHPHLPSFEELGAMLLPSEAAKPYLERLGLAEPSGLRERALQKAVLYALAEELGASD